MSPGLYYNPCLIINQYLSMVNQFLDQKEKGQILEIIESDTEVTALDVGGTGASFWRLSYWHDYVYYRFLPGLLNYAGRQSAAKYLHGQKPLVEATEPNIKLIKANRLLFLDDCRAQLRLESVLTSSSPILPATRNRKRPLGQRRDWINWSLALFESLRYSLDHYPEQASSSLLILNSVTQDLFQQASYHNKFFSDDRAMASEIIACAQTMVTGKASRLS